MSDLESKVLAVVSDLLAGTGWQSPSGGVVPLSFYAGRVPERGADTAVGLDAEAGDFEEPFLLVRETGWKLAEPQDSSSVLLWAQLYDESQIGRDELYRLAGYLRGLTRSEEYSPWSVDAEMHVQFGDDHGNQADPVFISLFKLNFYKGTESFG